MPSPRTVNIVIPCYNEENRLPADEVLEFVSTRPWLRFTLVDDGSQDGTSDIILDMARRSEGRIEALVFDVNQGKAEAVRQGMRHAFNGSNWAVGFWDADLATPLLDIEQFTTTLKSNDSTDLVIGSRVQLLGRHINRNPRRHYFGRIAATVVSGLLRMRVYDTQCGAKLFRTSDHMRGLFADPFITKWLFDVEILVRWKAAIQEEGFGDLSDRIVEIPLKHWSDVSDSKLSSADMAKAPTELLRIYWHYRHILK